MSNVYDRARVPEFTFGDRLRKAREHAGVSTDEMAAVLEVSARTIGNYENERTPVKGPVIKEWAMRCGVPVEWLRSGTVPTPDPGGEAVTGQYRPIAPIRRLAFELVAA